MRHRQSSRIATRLSSPCVETLEGRRLLAATGKATLIGYLPDYEISAALTTTLKNAAYAGLTQLDYFSVLPTAGGLLPGTTVNGVSNTSTQTSGGYALTGASSALSQLVTNAHAAGLKVVLVIGGGGSQSDLLTSVVQSNAATWQTFATSVQQFANARGIDGVDLDWEPSTLASTDTANYGNLLATLRATNPGLILSSAVNSEKLPLAGGGSAYVLNKTAMQSLTQINVMAYDLEAGNVSPIAHAETALAGWGTYATNNAISKSKLIFGMPFYGTSGTSWANTTALKYTDLVARNGTPMSPSADSVVLAGTTWNYNGPTTIGNKVAYALDNGYGGALTWEIGQDYIPNGTYNSTYSLLPQFAKATAAHTGTIAGTVTTTGGSAMAGATVFLDLNANGALDASDLSAVTSSTGAYSFSSLLIGTYAVGEVLPAGYTQVAPSSATLSAASTAGTTTTASFVVAPPLVATAVALVNNGSSTSDATQTASFTATLTGGVPDGATVTLKDGGIAIATASLVGGTVTFTLAAGTLLAGAHSLAAAYAGNAAFAASQSAAIALVVQVVVKSVVVNGNNAALAGAQDSMVDGVVYTFSEPVDVAATNAFAIAVHAGNGGTLPTLAWTALNPAGDGASTRWAVTFAGAGVLGGSIADGAYDLAISSAAITSRSNVAVAGQASAFVFTRLFGDANGDGKVDVSDLGLLATIYGTSVGSSSFNAALDVNADGAIDVSDLGELATRYGATIIATPAPAAVVVKRATIAARVRPVAPPRRRV